MKNLRLTVDFFRLYAMPKAGGSFATLFFERRVGMGFIQELLGHSSSKTTEIYTHITKKGFENLKSPFDSLGFEKNNTVLFSHPKKGAKQHTTTK